MLLLRHACTGAKCIPDRCTAPSVPSDRHPVVDRGCCPLRPRQRHRGERAGEPLGLCCPIGERCRDPRQWTRVKSSRGPVRNASSLGPSPCRSIVHTDVTVVLGRQDRRMPSRRWKRRRLLADEGRLVAGGAGAAVAVDDAPSADPDATCSVLTTPIIESAAVACL